MSDDYGGRDGEGKTTEGQAMMVKKEKKEYKMSEKKEDVGQE